MKLFVYYKFLPADYDHLSDVIRELQAKVQIQFPSMKSGLLRRPELNEKGEQTWMESYEIDSSDLPVLRQLLGDLARERAIPQTRFYEVFVDIEP